MGFVDTLEMYRTAVEATQGSLAELARNKFEEYEGNTSCMDEEQLIFRVPRDVYNQVVKKPLPAFKDARRVWVALKEMRPEYLRGEV